MRMRYREQSVFAQMNLLDSHDVSRFSSLCGGDEEAYELAVLFLMTFPGMPSVFYGDELGVTGLCEDDYRQAMPWERAAVSKAADTGYSRQQLFIKKRYVCGGRRRHCGAAVMGQSVRRPAAGCMSTGVFWRLRRF